VALIAKASIDEVVAAADMIDVVGQYTQLKKAGANYSGRCPFHQEKTPSFSVNPVEKLYYCFGCGEGGDLLSFVQKKENLDFAGAVESLADRYGISLTYDETSGAGDADRKRRERLRKLLEQSRDYYERVLWDSPTAATVRDYLAGRGLGEEVCRAYRLGFSPGGWGTLRDGALKKGFTERELLDAGLVVPGKSGRAYDRFRGRLMFPLSDERGRVLGFGARTLGDEKPKYLNSPETPLYHKSEALFGLDKAKAEAARADRLFVVEGYTDVLALVQAGVANVVASMGTALTEQQLKRMARITRNIVLCFDADAAGVGAMQRALELARRLDMVLHVVRVPDGLDPADYIGAGHDGDAFRSLAAQAETLLQFQVRTVLATHDVSSVDGRLQAFVLLRGILSQAPTPLERDEEVRFVADRLQLSEDNVRFMLSDEAVKQAGRGAARRAAGAAGQSGPPRRSAGERLLMGAHELETRFLAGCLALPRKGLTYLAAIDEDSFSSASARRAFAVVVERLGAAQAGNSLQGPEAETRAHADDQQVIAEVVMRATSETFSEHVLEELFLRVQDAHLARLIARLKVEVANDETGRQEKRLLEIEAMRKQIREAIRAMPVDEEGKS
jgi:DNA primase